MSDEAYPLQGMGKDEEFLSFSGNAEDQACIGHLRGDFARGTEFWTTWWVHQEELVDQDFKDELDSVVNALRKNGPLKNLSAMQSFCWKHKQAQMSPESGKDYYGFRVDTPKRRYYLRFLPLRGNYNFYIYCYQTDKLERAAELPPREERMSKQTIKVLVVEPTKPCEVREILPDLKSLQGVVGGKIEMVSPFTESAAIICNAEGKNLNLPPNRLLCDCYGDPYDVLCGTFLIVGVGGENFISLTDFQLRSYKEMFDHPHLLAIPLEAPDSPEKPTEQKKKRGKTHER